MLSFETKCKLSDVLLAIGDGERQIEVIRQVLNEQADFETYAAFQRIDRNKRKKITSYDISKFLADNNILQSEDACSAFIKRYDIDQDGSLNYTEFLNSVLVLTNKDLRKAVTSRPNYFVGPKETLKPEVEYSLAKLLDKEITYYLGLDYLKIILHNRYDYNVMDAFAAIDRHSRGCVEFNNLQNFFFGQSLNPKDEELYAILRRIDKKTTGKIFYDEFAEALEIHNKSNSIKKQSPKKTEKLPEKEDPLAKSGNINRELRFSESNLNRISFKPSEEVKNAGNITFEGDSARLDKYAPYKSTSPAPVPTYSPDKNRTSLIRLTPADGSNEVKVGTGTPSAKKGRHYQTASTSFTTGKKSLITDPGYKSPDRVLGATLRTSDLVDERNYMSRQSNLDKSVSPNKKRVTFSADQEALSKSEFDFRKRIEKERQQREVNAFIREKSQSPARKEPPIAKELTPTVTSKVEVEKKELLAADRKAAFIAAELEKLKLENEKALELRLGHRGLKSRSPRKMLSPTRTFSPAKTYSPIKQASPARAVTLGDERDSINKIEMEIRKRLEKELQSKEVQERFQPRESQIQTKEFQPRESQLQTQSKEFQSRDLQTREYKSPVQDKTSSPIRKTPTQSAEKSVVTIDKKQASAEPKKWQAQEEEADNDALVFTLKQFVNLDKTLEVSKQDLALRPDFNILDFFRVFDSENKGAINFNEFEDGLKHFALYANREELHLLVRKFDKDKDGRLRFSDFAEIVTPKQSDYSNLLHNRTPFKADIINSVHEVSPFVKTNPLGFLQRNY